MKKWFDVMGVIVDNNGDKITHTIGIKAINEEKAMMWFKRFHDTVEIIEVKERV